LVADESAPVTGLDSVEKEMARGNLDALIKQKEKEMKAAAKALEFERAAEIRDEIYRLKQLLPPVPHKR